MNLAVLLKRSSFHPTLASERAFSEASLKLSVMVFRFSVLESRAKGRSVFRPKKATEYSGSAPAAPPQVPHGETANGTVPGRGQPTTGSDGGSE